MFGVTGVDPDSLFVLRTPEGYGDKKPLVTLYGQPDPIVTQEDGNTYIIKPSITLTPNKLYVFTVDGITWTFQTSVRFELVSTFPRNQAVNVPVRTGIEFEFSHGDKINLENYFSIFPKVDGNFEYKDSTTIFIPEKPLEMGTIYTVNLKEGVKVPGSDEMLGMVRTFSFETEVESKETQKWNSKLHFLQSYREFPTFVNPSIDFRLNYDQNSGRPEVKLAVYKLNKDGSELASAIRQIGAPRWSRFNSNTDFINTSQLDEVFSSSISPNKKDNWGSETFTVPKNLTEGFYVVESTVSGTTNQMILQITDLAVQLVADESKVIAWVNDMTTGQPIIKTKVLDFLSGEVVETNEYGIAVIERDMAIGDYLVLNTPDGKQSTVFVDYDLFQTFNGVNFDEIWEPHLREESSQEYWTALQLDRTLFQRSDTVNFWGFVKNRNKQEDIAHVRVELRSQDSWRWERQGRDLLHTQNIPVVQGSYTGEIDLPNIDPGSYELTVFYGEHVLNSIFFSVMDYEKPPYKLTVSSDRNAVFAGEDVLFKAKTEFFEGTPVSDLELRYNFSGWGLNLRNEGKDVTNIDGEVLIKDNPVPVNMEIQGETSFMLDVAATLPEIGWTLERAGVRVFVNNIDVQAKAVRENEKASITVNVKDITLDRLNNGTAEHWMDYLDKPTVGQKLSVEVNEIYWEKVLSGETYCNITRKTIPWYRHERKERLVDSFELVTDSKGEATKEFTVPNKEYVSYQAHITTKDSNGRQIVETVYIGKDYTQFFYSAEDSRLFLDGVNPDGYDVGDKVDLTVMRGTDVVEQGNFMFIVVSNGILSYHIGKNPLELTFEDKYVPNVQVFAYHFNGQNYNSGWEMSKQLRFNTEERQLDIGIVADADTYKPGGIATLTITTKDKSGNPKAANVNISLVDEALLALMDYQVDTLDMLYSGINDSLKFSIATHSKFEGGGFETLTNGIGGKGFDTGSLMMVDSAESVVGETAHIRERFEDTAIFTSVRTNEEGVGFVNIPLPDNITSWRATISAISNDLYAGNGLENLNVTQPMFLNYSLNKVFLAGDIPYIGVNVYGTSLTGEEKVTFEVWRESDPEDIKTAVGEVFARVNIPLWEMNVCKDVLVVKATVGDLSDIVKHEYQVVNSHRMIDSVQFYEVSTDTQFEVNDGGLTSITFSDKGRSQFLGDLFALRNSWWRSGARIEGIVARRETTNLIQENFPDIELYGEPVILNIKDYQQASGGISVLPHAEADLLTTVRLLPFIKDEVNVAAITDYLYNIFESSETENKVVALYGLALLKEPVLLELKRYAELDLSVRDISYIALGLEVLGERPIAEVLYTTYIEPYIQDIALYKRVNIGFDQANILDVTSVTALLAAQLGKAGALDLHKYVVSHRWDAVSEDRFEMSVEWLNFIRSEIQNYDANAASITYTLFGESVTRELDKGRSFTLKIPTQNMNEFKLTNVQGSVGAVSIVRIALEEIEEVADIVIERQYSKDNSYISSNIFEQGDLVMVQIKVSYPQTALTGPYEVTDFLPAGLVQVPDSTKADGSWIGSLDYVQTDGQRITFYDFNGERQVNTYHYYARVVNPGQFVAEGPLLQSLSSRSYIAVGEESKLQINP